MNLRSAVQKIEKNGMLLVFPIKNAKEPSSLWSEFYPRSKMRWEWDAGADGRVPKLWQLREALSRSQKVVYTKWYRGRATFFSREVFVALLRVFLEDPCRTLSSEAQDLLRLLEENSPLSTKQLKKLSRLEGRFNEGAYTRALKELWTRLLVVGFGEVDDGAFPSLAVGATQWMFEDLWKEAHDLTAEAAKQRLQETLGTASVFAREWERVAARLTVQATATQTEIKKKMIFRP